MIRACLCSAAALVAACATPAPVAAPATPALARPADVTYDASRWSEPPAQDARWIELDSVPSDAEVYGPDEDAGPLARTPWRTQVSYAREPEFIIRKRGYEPVRVVVRMADHGDVIRVRVTLTPGGVTPSSGE